MTSLSYSIIAAILLCVPNLVQAASSNYAPVAINLPAFSKECLYFDLVSHDDSLVVSYQVLAGGNFEVDFQITAPDGTEIVNEKQKKFSDFLVRSYGLGQYEFCFSNTYGTALKKIEIVLELEKGSIASEGEESPEDIIASNSIEEIDRSLLMITKTMSNLRGREHRNKSTVESTGSRLTWLSLLIMGVTVGISVLQALIIQFFFQSRSRNYV
ncbi:hypothetical protein HG535_0E05370 [Zygotorulaspora mrakii]|uniref:GOLD domain-containing protein n=1 Tax=Zygotorulaspora mrakii TaxID=42260 RepID=A0A7H9B4R4_ZYGMR|nr:uncharacterized protein HG535_0E05370 [Zygotorulaspora mrakii]QLG73453.1 hypothetical protein HG535_0E05370 [Zygotorulaspora mrakii]